MIAKGDSGSIEVTAEAVLIHRRKILGSSDDFRAVKINDLSGLEFRRASVLESGYIKLIISGGGSSSDFSNKSHDRNAVTFSVVNQPEFLKVRALLMEKITGSPFVDNDKEDVHAQITAVIAGGVTLMVVIWILSTMLSN